MASSTLPLPVRSLAVAVQAAVDAAVAVQPAVADAAVVLPVLPRLAPAVKALLRQACLPFQLVAQFRVRLAERRVVLRAADVVVAVVRAGAEELQFQLVLNRL